MSYRYVALVGVDRNRGTGGVPLAKGPTQRDPIRECFTSASIRVFVSDGTPCQPPPGGGFAVGHLFSRADTATGASARQLPEFPSQESLRTHFLKNFWGEYVLIQPADESVDGFTVTRDPSGGVPCLFSVQDGSGFITSSVALATHHGLYRKRVDWDSIALCLAYPNLKTSRTGLADIRELLPGCSLHANETDSRTELAWSPWDFVARERRYDNVADAAGDIRRTVSTVVKTWAGIDDSILMELSGGLDSSIVASCLKNTGSRITCCNVVTPVPGGDERQYAGQMADYLDVQLQTECLDAYIACAGVAPPPASFSPHMGILQHAVSNVMVSAGQRNGTSSFYLGAGGDTVFGLLTNAVPAADAMKERGLLAGISTIRDLSVLHQCTVWKAAQLTLRKMLNPPKSPCVPDRSFINPSMDPGPPGSHPWFIPPADVLPGDRERIFDLASNQLFRDMVFRGENSWVRMPLLSQPVLETSLRVPSWMSISGGRNRSVARSAFADTLPEEVLQRRSKGTFIGYLGALFKHNRNQIRDTLLTGSLQGHRLLDADALTTFFKSELPPRDKSFTRVLGLLMVENWVGHQT